MMRIAVVFLLLCGQAIAQTPSDQALTDHLLQEMRMAIEARAKAITLERENADLNKKLAEAQAKIKEMEDKNAK